MCPSRNARGGALVLVLACGGLIVALGIGFVLLIMLLGGGRELQNATDAGGLNVAKQSLKRPGVDLVGTDEVTAFGDLVDTDGKINLLTYNRLVGQSVLVALNAQEENTPQAAANALTMRNLVHGQKSSISGRLQTALITSEELNNQFTDIANQQSVRMLGAKRVGSASAQRDVAYLVRNTASNVFVNSNQVPSGASLPAGSTTNKQGKNYLVGYSQFTIGPSTFVAVPLRPFDKPRLVSRTEFSEGKKPPIEVIPPNAFQSAGTSQHRRSRLDASVEASAVVGSLDKDFPAAIPRGVIVIDNTGSTSGTGSLNTGNDIWTNKLMSPNSVQVLCNLVSDSSCFVGVKAFLNANPAPLTPAKQQELASMLSGCVDDPKPVDASSVESCLRSGSISTCNNTNTSSGGAPCNLNRFIDIYGGGLGGNKKESFSSLIAVEAYHAGVCAIRAGGDQCADFRMNQSTGLKAYPRSGCPGTATFTFSSEGTLNQLLQQTGGTSAKGSLAARLHQIKPSASNAEIEGVFNQTVPFDKVSYIYLRNGALILTVTPPPWPVSLNADGSRHNFESSFSLDGLANCDGDCGYPHPWDCPLTSQGVGMDSLEYTPSTGFRNLLGILKFRNRAQGGGRFCCPC